MEAVEGIAKKECLEKDKLIMTSPPEEWIKALFSGTQMPIDPKHIASPPFSPQEIKKCPALTEWAKPIATTNIEV